MKSEDVNIRITKSTHRNLKITAASFGLNIKDLVGMMSTMGQAELRAFLKKKYNL